MKTSYKNLLIHITTWLMILLFIYTASDKLMNFKTFSAFLVGLEYLGGYSHLLAVVIPLLEIAISLLLLIPTMRTEGLYAALVLMLLFTLYLVFIKLTAPKLPCNCGGVISSLSWVQHIWFNLGLIGLLFCSVLWKKKGIAS